MLLLIVIQILQFLKGSYLTSDHDIIIRPTYRMLSRYLS